jgi:hypothetical protein
MQVDPKRFWQWCIILGITGFSDFVHRLPASQSVLQPWVSLGLLYNQSPLLGFWTKLFFTGWGCQPHAQPPLWRTKVFLLVWTLPFELMAWVALLTVTLPLALISSSQESHKPHHHDKVETPLGGLSIVWYSRNQMFPSSDGGEHLLCWVP